MRFRFIIPLLCVLLSTAAAAAEPPLRVAVDSHYPPFGYIDKTGGLAGFDVDIAVALCSELRRECIISGKQFDEIIPGIVRGDIDFAVAGLGDTPERLTQVDFTDRYYRSHSIFIKSEKATLDLSPDGMAGKFIGVQTGSVQETYLKKAFPRSVLAPKPTLADLMRDLKADETSAVLAEGLAGFSYLKTPEGAGLEASGPPIQDQLLSGPSCIAVSKKMPQLTRDLNKALETIRRNGEYARINRKFFDFDVY